MKSYLSIVARRFVRRIVREELHAYEKLLIEWITKDEITGVAHRNVRYEEFIDRVLLNDDSKTEAD